MGDDGDPQQQSSPNAGVRPVFRSPVPSTPLASSHNGLVPGGGCPSSLSLDGACISSPGVDRTNISTTSLQERCHHAYSNPYLFSPLQTRVISMKLLALGLWRVVIQRQLLHVSRRFHHWLRTVAQQRQGPQIQTRDEQSGQQQQQREMASRPRTIIASSNVLARVRMIDGGRVRQSSPQKQAPVGPGTQQHERRVRLSRLGRRRHERQWKLLMGLCAPASCGGGAAAALPTPAAATAAATLQGVGVRPDWGAVALRIFSFLDLGSLHSAMMCCVSWSRIVLLSPLLQTHWRSGRGGAACGRLLWWLLSRRLRSADAAAAAAAAGAKRRGCSGPLQFGDALSSSQCSRQFFTLLRAAARVQFSEQEQQAAAAAAGESGRGGGGGCLLL